jgi:hypothetical protein
MNNQNIISNKFDLIWSTSFSYNRRPVTPYTESKNAYPFGLKEPQKKFQKIINWFCPDIISDFVSSLHQQLLIKSLSKTRCYNNKGSLEEDGKLGSPI